MADTLPVATPGAPAQALRRRGLIVPAGLTILAGALLFLAPFLAGLWGAGGPIAATVKMGPNTGAYLTGASPEYEIEGLQATRWTSYDTTLALPLTVAGGPLEVSYRFARVLPQTAVVDVLLDGRQIDRFSCRGGVFQTRTAHLSAVGTVPLELRFKVDSHDRRNLGLKLDWVRLSAGPGSRMRLRGSALWLAPLLAVALLALLRFAGHSLAASALLAAPVSLAAVVGLWLDPFAFAHIALRTALAAGLLAAALAVALRRVPGGRWVMVIVVLGYLVKGAGLFHPSSFYPDYQHNRRYALAVAESTGSLAERSRVAQREIGVAYPRFIAGKDYAFAYSPLAYVPLAVFGDPDTIEDAFRQASLLAVALEAVLVFWLAHTLVLARRPRDGEPATAPAELGVLPVTAALLAILLPSNYSRLLLAMNATLFGHVWDVCLVLAVLFYLLRPERRLRLLPVALFALLSLLTYISSLFTVSALLCFVAILERRHALRLLLILAGAAGLTVAWLYAPFVREFVTEILPAVLGGAHMATAPGVPTGPGAALHRIDLFFGVAYPALSLAGLVLLRRRLDARAFHVLAAYGLAFLLLVALRAFGGGLFRDLKEVTFVGPLVAVLAATAIVDLGARGRSGRAAAVMIVIGLAWFGLAKYHEYLRTYASPFVQVREARDL